VFDNFYKYLNLVYFLSQMSSLSKLIIKSFLLNINYIINLFPIFSQILYNMCFLKILANINKQSYIMLIIIMYDGYNK